MNYETGGRDSYADYTALFVILRLAAHRYLARIIWARCGSPADGSAKATAACRFNDAEAELRGRLRPGRLL